MISEQNHQVVLLLLLWTLAFVLLIGQAWRERRPVAGLALSYLMSLAVIHLVAGFIQILPWHVSPMRNDTIAGFQVTGYAVAGLLIGVFAAAPFFAPLVGKSTVQDTKQAWWLGWIFAFGGLAAYFLILPIGRYVPSVSSVLSGGLMVALAGTCLIWWCFYQKGRHIASWLVVISSVVFPFLTLILQGFLGYGVAAVVVLFCFVIAHYKPRWFSIVFGVVGVSVGISLFSVYFQNRKEIRRFVGEGRGIGDRLKAIEGIASKWEWADSHDNRFLRSIEGRLNQNWLIGASVRQLEVAESVEFASGETLLSSLLAIVPRVIWPDKPEFGGSGDLVTRFTGFTFASETSVGIGHVMEFYVNFGVWGVFFGYVALGMILGMLDHHCGRLLRDGDWRRFAPLFAMGLALMQVNGNFAEVTASAVGTLVFCWGILTVFKNYSPARPVAKISSYPLARDPVSLPR